MMMKVDVVRVVVWLINGRLRRRGRLRRCHHAQTRRVVRSDHLKWQRQNGGTRWRRWRIEGRGRVYRLRCNARRILHHQLTRRIRICVRSRSRSVHARATVVAGRRIETRIATIVCIVELDDQTGEIGAHLG